MYVLMWDENETKKGVRNCKGARTCAASAHSLDESALWDELDFKLAVEELLLELGVLSDVRGEHLVHLMRVQQPACAQTREENEALVNGTVRTERIS